MKVIVLVGGDSPKKELIVWLYLNQAIFSLLRLFSAAGQLVFPFYLSFDRAFMQCSPTLNQSTQLLPRSGGNRYNSRKHQGNDFHDARLLKQ